MEKRIDWIDVAKGLAMIMVLYGHIIPKETLVSKFIYCFHMPVFFILSGYGLSLKKNFNAIPLKNFLFDKLKKLLYPYFIFSFLSIPFFFVYESGDSWKYFVKKTLLLEGDFAFWFLPALFFAELFFFVLIKFLEKKVCLFFLLSFVFFILEMNVFHTLNKNLFYVLIFERALLAFQFIYLGYKLSFFINYKENRRLHYFIFSFFCFLVLAFVFDYNESVDMKYMVLGNSFLFYANAFLGSFFVLFFSLFLKTNRFLCLIGVNSLILMCTQSAWHIVGISNRLSLVIPFSNKNLYIQTLVALSFSIVIELVIANVINKKCRFLLKI